MKDAMAEELLIQVTDFESRVALVKDGAVHEIHLARSSGYSVTGNIYLGKVVRIIPGMQAAFIDIGLERPGFLHASDVKTSRKAPGKIPAPNPQLEICCTMAKNCWCKWSEIQSARRVPVCPLA